MASISAAKSISTQTSKAPCVIGTEPSNKESVIFNLSLLPAVTADGSVIVPFLATPPIVTVTGISEPEGSEYPAELFK